MFAATSFKGKRVGLFGLARSGLACWEALKLGGADVLGFDDSDAAVAQARSMGLISTDLHQTDFNTLDALVLSPGVPLTHPEPHWAVKKAKAAGIEVIGDTEVFAREIANTGAKLIAITGTNGKSTTTALIGHVLKTAGLDAEVGGNIGRAVFLLPPPVKGRIYVLELSSFQIDLMPGLRPDVGILTNITPDHLDRHGAMENYAAVKARMFARQGLGDTALIAVDDPYTERITRNIAQDVSLRLVSVKESLDDGISVVDGLMTDRGRGLETTIDLAEMTALRGVHNWQNAAFAYGAAKALGVNTADIIRGLTTFPGLQHRMQQVAVLKNMIFVNDSKATNADAAAKALASFDAIYWIAGGVAKAGGIAALQAFYPRIKHAYLIGEAASSFGLQLQGKVNFTCSETLEKAVVEAEGHAAADGIKGATVLLSPACASFDQYKNFEIRGCAFVELVSKLPGVQMLDLGDA